MNSATLTSPRSNARRSSAFRNPAPRRARARRTGRGAQPVPEARAAGFGMGKWEERLYTMLFLLVFLGIGQGLIR